MESNLMALKPCSTCRVEQPLTSFGRSKVTPDGLEPRCRNCRSIAGKRHNIDVERRRVRHNTRLYGLSHEDYLDLLETQGGVCAICHQPETMTYKGSPKSLCVDHDHDTGKVRGLLCAACNFALGKFQDDPARLRAAADYLEAGQ